MHGFEGTPNGPGTPSDDHRPWYMMLTRYHWFVLMVAALGWMFDCLDQQLFILARQPAMEQLVYPVRINPQDENSTLDLDATEKKRNMWSDIATSVFMAGWASGGLFFGVLGDRIGRAKTMLITILLYSLCTGLSALSVGAIDFAFYRFLTGLGVGGEFAVGVALVSEVMPQGARSQSLALLQALSAVGNISAAMINLGLGIAGESGSLGDTHPWRIMFLVGAVPALLALVIRAKLKEPEAWQKVSHDTGVKKQLGSYRELFADPTLRRHAIFGLILGCSGIIGLWSVGFFTTDLIRQVQRPRVTVEVYQAELRLASGESDRFQKLTRILEKTQRAEPLDHELSPLQDELRKKIDGQLSRWTSYVSLMQNLGAALGMIFFGALAKRIGRKPAFVIAFLAAFVSTASVFWYLSEFWQVFVMVPIMGFFQLSLFALYAIYFPELFPTRLRSTGISFCYNVGRFAAALGPLAKWFLRDVLFGFASQEERVRYAGVAMSCVFLVGLFVLPLLPETRGKPLPE